MSWSAKLISIEAVQLLATALRRFGEEAGVALTDLDLEVKRAIQWIRQDRKLYWEEQVRRSWEQVNEARITLERCLLFSPVGHRSSCYDERKALERAKQRLHLAEDKQEAVRRWTHTLEREFIEYRGNVAQLASWLELDLPRTLALLDRMTGALETYVAVKAPADDGPQVAEAAAEEEPGESASGKEAQP